MTIDTTICIAGALLGLAGLIFAIHAAREARRLRARCESFESSLAALRRELELAASMTTTTERRVSRIEQDYSSVADRIDLVELRGAAQSFDQAIDSAQQGADPGKLAQQFGLSRAEAELVTRLHGRKRSA